MQVFNITINSKDIPEGFNRDGLIKELGGPIVKLQVVPWLGVVGLKDDGSSDRQVYLQSIEQR